MYHSNIPTQLDYKSMKKNDWIKARTQELYDMLPQTSLADREKYTDIRDEIIELNYSFFGYIAKNQYVTDPLVTYEDKLQSALVNFCDMWAKYKFAPEYRTDLSFSVFFKPRLSECIRRELNIIKYSLRRSVCMKAAAQLGKHWGEITKDDIPKVHLPHQDMMTLEAIFNTQNDTPYVDDGISRTKTTPADYSVSYGIDNIYTEEYDKLEDLIVHEMIEQECKLEDSYLLKMSRMYDIPYQDLLKARPIGEEKLKHQLEESMYIKEAFESETGFGDNSDDTD